MNNITEEIKNRCNIVDVVGRYVRLRRTGSDYMGLCPFHSEKTPSFSVSERKQFFYCFGCGESGDVISFVQKVENIDFMTAVRRLADSYGINMDDYGYRNESRNNRIYDINRDAAYFFLHNLVDRPNPGRDYILNRGLDLKTIAKFGIGYAPDSWNALLNYMSGKGYQEDQLVRAGLLSASRGKYYDRFRGRVIFPIINTRGKVLGFGGRILSDGQPKYLNSPESPVFSKRNNLFGLNLTRKEIADSDCAIIVEGYMDMVSLYQSGVKNVAATLGTALTGAQCRLISRYTKNIILSYDADNAGRNAALRGIEVIRKAGLNARVLHVTDGKDPDEYVRKYGRDAFLDLTEKALSYADYRLEQVRSGADLETRQGRMWFVKAAAAVIRDLDPVESELYIEKVAGEAGIQEGALRREAAAAGQGREQAGTWQPANSRDRNDPAPGAAVRAGLSLQKTLIGLLVKKPELIPDTMEYAYVFTDPVCYRIVSVIFSMFEEEGGLDPEKLADTLMEEDAAMLESITGTEVLDVDTDRVWKDCIGRIRISELRKKHRELEDVLELLPENDSRTEEIMKQLREIDARVLKLKKNPGSE